MARNGFELPHAIGTEAVPQRVDQRRTTFGIILRRMYSRDIQFGLPCRRGFGARDGKADSLETEAAIVLSRERFEFKIDQSRYMRHAARRRRQSNIDRLYRSIDAIEAQPQRARAGLVAYEHMHQVLHETTGARENRLVADDRFKQIIQAVINRRRGDRDKRFVAAAERLVQPAEQFVGKACGKWGPWLVQQRA